MEVLKYTLNRLPALMVNGLGRRWRFMLSFSVLAMLISIALPVGITALSGIKDSRHAMNFILAKKIVETVSESMLLLYAPVVLIYLESVIKNNSTATIKGFMAAFSQKIWIKFVVFSLLTIVIFVLLQTIAFNIFGIRQADSIASDDQAERIAAYGNNYFKILRKYLWTVFAAILCFNYLEIKLNKATIKKYGKTFLGSLAGAIFLYYGLTSIAEIADRLLVDFMLIFNPPDNDTNQYYFIITTGLSLFIFTFTLGYFLPIFGAVIYYPIEYLFNYKKQSTETDIHLPNYPDIE